MDISEVLFVEVSPTLGTLVFEKRSRGYALVINNQTVWSCLEPKLTVEERNGKEASGVQGRCRKDRQKLEHQESRCSFSSSDEEGFTGC
jgi:hypothetical protein